jgi:hypothetical protein
MVMEHLNETCEIAFLTKSAEFLNEGGLMIGLVPGSPAHWGIEDEIAGHCRRHARESIRELMMNNDWRVGHISGLTFPVSNLLLPLSNLLVRRNERSKLDLSELEKTTSSGRRQAKFKTHFPVLLCLILNRHVMLPLHYMQKTFGHSARSLVIYFEARRNTGRPD